MLSGLFVGLPMGARPDACLEDHTGGSGQIEQTTSGMLGMRVFILHAARIASWCLSAVITVLSLVPPNLRPETAAPHSLEHFAIFFATGIAFGLGYSRRPGIVAVALVIFAGAIEIAQKLVPGRHARWSDFIVDALALCVGVAMASFVGARTLQRSAPSAGTS